MHNDMNLSTKKPIQNIIKFLYSVTPTQRHDKDDDDDDDDDDYFGGSVSFFFFFFYLKEKTIMWLEVIFFRSCS